MTLQSLLPRNEAGAPRRLRGHGEAVRWAAGVVSRFAARRFVPALIVCLLADAAIRYFSAEGSFDPGFFVPGAMMALGSLVALGTASVTILYPYVVLSGGVMRRIEWGRNGPGR